MMTFTEISNSKEIKIRRLNGWLRIATWVILFLVAVGTILGLLYWQRTKRSEVSFIKAREAAIALIVRAITVSDSLNALRHEELLRELRALHPKEHIHTMTAETLNARTFYEQLQPQKRK